MLDIKKNAITGNIVLLGGKFGCTFFEGHLFPVFFTDAAGNPAGSTRWEDGLEVDGVKYTLRDERWAEFSGESFDGETYRITTKGVFCGGDDRIFLLEYPELTIQFDWQIPADGDVIKVDIKLTGEPEKPVDLRLCSPVMRFAGDKNILHTGKYEAVYSGGGLELKREIKVTI